MDNATIGLLLVEDDARVASAWKRLIGQQKDIRMVAVLDRADGLLSAVRDHRPNVVMIDLTMEGRDPLDAIAELSREHPAAKVVVYTGQSRHEWGERARRAGAAAYLDKMEMPDVVLKAVRDVGRRSAEADHPPHGTTCLDAAPLG